MSSSASSHVEPAQRDGAQPAAGVALRPVGSPIPLAFAGLAIASLLISGQQLGWYGTAPDKTLVAALLLAAVVPLQAVAAVWSFAARSAPAATACGVLAGTWAAIALASLLGPPAPGLPTALGVVLLTSSALLVGSALVEASGSAILPAVVLTLAGLRFAVTGVYAIANTGFWQDIAGIVGLVVAGAALLAVIVLQHEATSHRPVRLVGRRSGDADPRLDPGVRPTL